MSVSTAPFDDIRPLVLTLPAPDDDRRARVQTALSEFSGPKPPLGHGGEALVWLGGWSSSEVLLRQKPLIAVFAGSHDVAGSTMEGAVVRGAKSRVASLTNGPASVRGMAGNLGAAYKVFEMGLEYPVPDITQAESLSERDCAAAIAFGMEVVAEGADIIALGNAGYGSATAAAAIAMRLYGGTAEYWAGAHNHTAAARIEAVQKAIAFHGDALSDPLHTLRCLGGRDIAGLIGAILAARHQSIPVILDGFVVCIAAAVLHAINPDATAHCLAGHCSAEPAHAALLDRLGLKPMHEFGIALGDGTGAAYALGSLQLSAAGFASLTGAD